MLYPLIRDAKLANDPMVASTVGATVLTDTIALVILAVVAGTQSGSGSGAEIAVQIAIGLTVLGLFCFVLLPIVVRRLFRLLGTERTVRYVIAVAAFLAAAVVAETFQIEGIVGAFFAGLAMNRLVPNEGPLMSRIDFFGSALFVPGVPRLGRAAAQAERDDPERDARARRAVHRGLHRRQVPRRAVLAAARSARPGSRPG